MSRVKKEGKARIFNQSYLEIFTKTNPYIHVITYGSMIWFLLSQNQLSLLLTTTLLVSGIFTWTLMEYLMHRYLFHIRFKKLQYFIHGVHHEYPRDRERLLMPPLPGVIYSVLIFGLYYFFMRGYTFSFMSGIIVGYMLYTFVHYIIHTWKPVKGLKFLWTHHHRHHNPAFEETSFGVSSPLWDYVFGTMPDRGEKNHLPLQVQEG